MRNEVDPVCDRIETVVKRDRKSIDNRVKSYDNEYYEEYYKENLESYIACTIFLFHIFPLP